MATNEYGSTATSLIQGMIGPLSSLIATKATGENRELAPTLQAGLAGAGTTALKGGGLVGSSMGGLAAALGPLTQALIGDKNVAARLAGTLGGNVVSNLGINAGNILSQNIKNTAPLLSNIGQTLPNAAQSFLSTPNLIGLIGGLLGAGFSKSNPNLASAISNISNVISPALAVTSTTGATIPIVGQVLQMLGYFYGQNREKKAEAHARRKSRGYLGEITGNPETQAMAETMMKGVESEGLNRLQQLRNAGYDDFTIKRGFGLDPTTGLSYEESQVMYTGLGAEDRTTDPETTMLSNIMGIGTERDPQFSGQSIMNPLQALYELTSGTTASLIDPNYQYQGGGKQLMDRYGNLHLSQAIDMGGTPGQIAKQGDAQTAMKWIGISDAYRNAIGPTYTPELQATPYIQRKMMQKETPQEASAYLKNWEDAVKSNTQNVNKYLTQKQNKWSLTTAANR